MRKIILFELNEVPFRVLESYCADNPGSAINRLYNESLFAQTVTPDTDWLHPWCTWPTLHRGVETEKHMLTNLSQNLAEVDSEYPPIWKILADKGASIGIAGSLHSWPPPEDREHYSFYLPDTFASDDQAFPEELQLFQSFNLAMVDRSGRNVTRGIAMSEATKLLMKYRKVGFGSGTARSILAQLASESINKNRKGRRRILQSVLAFDVFVNQLERYKPDLSTFFTNHVASSMHRYWAAKFPEDFEASEYDSEFLMSYGGEIDYAMGIADRFVHKLLEFVDQNPDFQLIVTTSMGQSACQETLVERQVYVDNADKFMAAFGVAPEQYERRRVMAPRFAAVVDSSRLEELRRLAGSLEVAGDAVAFEERDGGFVMFHFGQENLSEQDEFARIDCATLDFDAIGLKNTRIDDAAGSTGYHIPEGLLLAYDPRTRESRRIDGDVTTLDIAPAILDNFGVAAPSYMRSAQSLL